MLCPFCDYGTIDKAKIKDTDIEIYICEDCEMIWSKSDIIVKNDIDDFGILMKFLGRKPVWSELIDVEIIKEDPGFIKNKYLKLKDNLIKNV